MTARSEDVQNNAPCLAAALTPEKSTRPRARIRLKLSRRLTLQLLGTPGTVVESRLFGGIEIRMSSRLHESDTYGPLRIDGKSWSGLLGNEQVKYATSGFSANSAQRRTGLQAARIATQREEKKWGDKRQNCDAALKLRRGRDGDGREKRRRHTNQPNHWLVIFVSMLTLGVNNYHMRHDAASVDQWWPICSHQIELSHVRGKQLEWLGIQALQGKRLRNKDE
ncbi:hypothetical protein C8J57DRAFT_1222456 [Mycena rebaudengoi]|nr:hypothetical protein C8J57DRAFT_1222456 [Mycena rebaudengoi]